jgi:hypothetical protein
MSVDPKRIADEQGSPLAAMLQAAHDDVLTRDEVERVRAGLAASVAIAGVGATAALVAIGVAAGTAWVVARGASAESAPTTAAVSSPPAPATASSREAAPAPPPLLPEPPPEPQRAVLAEAPKALPRAAAPAPTLQPAAAPQPSSLAQPAPRPSVAPATPVSREGALLLEARAALEHDPARALALVREHERQFPDSQLAPERARIAAEATRLIQR